MKLLLHIILCLVEILKKITSIDGICFINLLVYQFSFSSFVPVNLSYSLVSFPYLPPVILFPITVSAIIVKCIFFYVLQILKCNYIFIFKFNFLNKSVKRRKKNYKIILLLHYVIIFQGLLCACVCVCIQITKSPAFSPKNIF